MSKSLLKQAKEIETQSALSLVAQAKDDAAPPVTVAKPKHKKVADHVEHHKKERAALAKKKEPVIQKEAPAKPKTYKDITEDLAE